MTLGNMRANGARSLDVSCSLCHHEAVSAGKGQTRYYQKDMVPCRAWDSRASGHWGI
jgi:hypothetical protein